MKAPQDWEKKILSFESAGAVMDELRAQGKTIIQCHGTFDLIHPGHIVHFQEAGALGDVLVVTITAGQHVNKGPGRPYFNDDVRLFSIASMACVDYVLPIPFPAAVEALECIRPDVYCKGTEYLDQSADVTGNIADDIATVERLGGRMEYVGSVTFSSTKLLNNHFQPAANGTRRFCERVLQVSGLESLLSMVEAFSGLRILVVGDIIFDKYSTVKVQGLTSKNRILSSRHMEDSMQAGGAFAVYRHLRQFAPDVKLVGVVGTEEWAQAEIRQHLDADGDALVRTDDFTTIVKHRFVEEHKDGQELSKLFSVNYIDEKPPAEHVADAVRKAVEAYIDQVDLVLAMDFGHGVFAPQVLEVVQDRAAFLAVNCQTNSNNYGFNVINRRFRRADMFSLDQNELHLACGKRYVEYEDELRQLRDYFDSEYAWLTRGGKETIGLRGDAGRTRCPGLEHNVVDPVGAGDAFFSVAAMAACSGLPLESATLLGQLAGAQAVRIVGNTESIKKATLLKGLEGLLKV